MAYAANINGFKLGYRMMLFVHGCHLSAPYKGTMLATCGLDADRTTTYSILSTQLCPPRVLKIGCGSYKASPTVWGVSSPSLCLTVDKPS